MNRRFDQASAVDAAFLLWGLVGFALFKLGGRLMKAADDNLADFPCCDEYPEVPL